MDEDFATVMIYWIDHSELYTEFIPLVEEIQCEYVLDPSLTFHVGQKLNISDPVVTALPVLGFVILMQNHVLILEKWQVSLDWFWSLPNVTLCPNKLTSELFPVSKLLDITRHT